MIYEETPLWEVLIPTERGSLETWEAVISNKIRGFTIAVQELQGAWDMKRELSIIVRIACSEETIKEILKATADHFIQECVMCYKVSNQCIMGHRE